MLRASRRPQFDLESQVNNAGARRMLAGNSNGGEIGFLFLSPPAGAIRVLRVNACNDPFRV